MYQHTPYTRAQGGCSVYAEFEEKIIIPLNENKIQVIVSRDELRCIHTNTIRCANRDATKFAKVHVVIMLGGEGNKPMIALSIDGISICPFQNQWHKALKSHIFQHLDICKSIDIQVVKKMEKVKANLEK